MLFRSLFNWIATLWRGSIEFTTPMLYALGFLFLFSIAGLTGLHLATLGTDVFLHDTYFVVAHFHYTMQGGTVVALIAGLYFWFPKITGRMYNEKIGRIGWALLFIGFNVTFFPQFFLGLEGMPRRYFDYLPRFHTWHFISTMGSWLNGLSYILILGSLLYSAFRGAKATANPYNALSLEWQTTSPPPTTNFDTPPELKGDIYDYGTTDDHSKEAA